MLLRLGEVVGLSGRDGTERGERKATAAEWRTGARVSGESSGSEAGFIDGREQVGAGRGGDGKGSGHLGVCDVLEGEGCGRSR